MTQHDNQTLVRWYVEEYFNNRNPGAADQALAPDVVLEHVGAPEPMRGLAAFTGFISTFQASFPDLRASVEDLFGQDDRVAARFIWSSTHRGDFLGVPPTGKPMRISGMAIYRIADGKIAQVWAHVDFMALLQQIGAMPMPTGVTAL